MLSFPLVIDRLYRRMRHRLVHYTAWDSWIQVKFLSGNRKFREILLQFAEKQKRATPKGVAQPALAVCIQMMTCTKRQVGRLSGSYLLPTSTHRQSVGGRSASRHRSIRRPGSMMWVQTDTSRTKQGKNNVVRIILLPLPHRGHPSSDCRRFPAPAHPRWHRGSLRRPPPHFSGC